MARLSYRSSWLLRSLGIGTLALASHASVASAQSVRLNGPLAQPRAGDVLTYALSADGTRVVFRADQEVDERFELYSAPSDGSAPPVKLNAALVAGGDVGLFALGLGRAVYRADQDVDGRFELFSVPLDGSAAPLRLSPTPSPFGFTYGVGQLRVSPDGTLVLFSFFDQIAALERLYSVPIDGSQPALELADSGAPPTFLSSALVELEFSADGKLALFISKLYDDQEEPQALFKVLVNGTQPALQLDTGAGSAGAFVLSQDATRVVFVEGITSQTELYAAAIDGTQRVQLNTPGKAVDELHVSPDGSRVIFVEGFTPAVQLVSIASDGTQRVPIGPTGPVPFEVALAPDWSRVAFSSNGSLYSAPVGGPAATLLAGPDVGPGLAISADSTTLVFTQTVASFRGLYALPIAGGASALLLNGPALAERGVALAGQTLMIRGARVVYRQERSLNEVIELFSVPLDAGQPEVRISAALGGPRDVLSFQLSLDGQRALYRADQANDETHEIYGATLTGGVAPVRYNTPLPAGPVRGDVFAYQSAASAGRVVYRADQDDDEVFDLYAAPLDGNGPSQRLSQVPTGTGGVASEFAVSPSGARAVFQHFPAAGSFFTLYAAATSGGGAPVELDGPSVFTAPYLFGAAETRVVYRRAGATAAAFDLCSAPLDGSGPAIRLHPNLFGRSVNEVQLAPGGERVVFRADHSVAGVTQLYQAPVDGSAPPLLLSPPVLAASNVDVMAFRISPDGTRVVYLADQELDQQFALYSVALAGGQAERLSGALVSGGDVTEFLVSGDGRTVVYRADQRSDNSFELFQVPIEGRRPPRRSLGGTVRTDPVLLTPMPAARSVQPDFALSADGKQVLYRANPIAARLELYRVAANGSSAPVALNAALVAGGAVLAFELAPDQGRVVYRADERTNDVIELFSVPLTGGPSVALDSLPPSGDVESFQIAPDSSFVAYRADRDVDGFIELFAAPLDGSAGARKLNGPLATGGDVGSDLVPLSGGRVLYRADQDADEVFELFEAFLGHALPARRPELP